jgi:serine O-acetyltransferase
MESPIFKAGKGFFLLRLFLSQSHNLIGYICARLLKRQYAIEIGSDVTIGKRLILPHPQGVIIGSGARIGNDVHIAQRVTIGGNFRKYRVENGSTIKMPVIGDNVTLLANCVVAGPIKIGSCSVIGANSVCTHDIPSLSLVTGQNRCKNLDLALIDHSRFAMRAKSYLQKVN